MGIELRRSSPHTQISKMMKLVLLCCLVGVVMSQSQCRYWCRNPQGQAYCCENNAQRPSAVVGTKRGTCPPVRPSCPPTRNFLPPQTCSNDGSCAGIDKCCYDTCLAEHVCKRPQSLFGGFGQGGFGQGGFGQGGFGQGGFGQIVGGLFG